MEGNGVPILLGIVAVVMVVEFFHIGYLVGKIRDNARVMCLQLEQLLKHQGIADPQAEREAMLTGRRR